MEQLICIFLSEFIVEWFFIGVLLGVFSVDEGVVIHGLFPLVLRGKLFECWELPVFECVVFCHALVSSHIHLEIELRLIWLPLVSSLFYQVLIGAGITSVVEVDAHWSQVALSGLSSLKDSSKLAVEVGLVGLSWVKTGLPGGLLGSRVHATILWSLDIRVPGQARQFLSPT